MEKRLVPVDKTRAVDELLVGALLIARLCKVCRLEIEKGTVALVARCEEGVVGIQALGNGCRCSTLRLDRLLGESQSHGATSIGSLDRLGRIVGVVRVGWCERLSKVLATRHEHGSSRVIGVKD
jgi:hypothetical protein